LSIQPTQAARAGERGGGLVHPVTEAARAGGWGRGVLVHPANTGKKARRARERESYSVYVSCKCAPCPSSKHRQLEQGERERGGGILEFVQQTQAART